MENGELESKLLPLESKPGQIGRVFFFISLARPFGDVTAADNRQTTSQPAQSLNNTNTSTCISAHLIYRWPFDPIDLVSTQFPATKKKKKKRTIGAFFKHACFWENERALIHSRHSTAGATPWYSRKRCRALGRSWVPVFFLSARS